MPQCGFRFSFLEENPDDLSLGLGDHGLESDARLLAQP